MITPDSEEDAKGDPLKFVVRFNVLVKALIVEPSVKLVARTAVDYGVRDGEDIYPGNERLARETCLSTETVRKAWKILRATRLAGLDVPSHWTGARRTADEYSLRIPDDWEGLPIYGPHSKRFTCQHCGHVFNPEPGTVLRPDGTVAWRLTGMVFCPPPGRPKRTSKRDPVQPKPPGCFDLWLRDHSKGWPQGNEAWEMFRKARDDEWP